MAVETKQIILAGAGGQGLILGGVTLAKAAVNEKKNAVQTQTYGIQTRGGYSQAEVIISEGTIYFPKCDQPDLVLTLTQTAYNKYRQKVTEDCIILYDTDHVETDNRKNNIGYPFSAKAIELGNEKVINSLFLGCVIKLCPVISKDALTQELEAELPGKAISLNLKAFELGYTEIG